MQEKTNVNKQINYQSAKYTRFNGLYDPHRHQKCHITAGIYKGPTIKNSGHFVNKFVIKRSLLLRKCIIVN